MNALVGLLWSVAVVATGYGLVWLLRQAMSWRPRAVYHIVGRDGEIIYVGSAYNIRSRMLRHRRDRLGKSLWYDDASPRFQMTLEPDYVRWYRNAALAFAAEDDDVRRYKPRGNRINVRRERMSD